MQRLQNELLELFKINDDKLTIARIQEYSLQFSNELILEALENLVKYGQVMKNLIRPSVEQKEEKEKSYLYILINSIRIY